MNGGVGIVEMLNKMNIMALVGGGNNPRWTPNRVIIWDDLNNQQVEELNHPSDVLAVKMREDLIVVFLRTKVYLSSFPDINLIG